MSAKSNILDLPKLQQITSNQKRHPPNSSPLPPNSENAHPTSHSSRAIGPKKPHPPRFYHHPRLLRKAHVPCAVVCANVPIRPHDKSTRRPLRERERERLPRGGTVVYRGKHITSYNLWGARARRAPELSSGGPGPGAWPVSPMQVRCRNNSILFVYCQAV